MRAPRLLVQLAEADLVELVRTAVREELAAQRTPAPAPKGPEHLTVPETAEQLRCSVRWVRQLISDRRLPATRIGTGSRPRVCIPRAAVEKLLAESTH